MLASALLTVQRVLKNIYNAVTFAPKAARLAVKSILNVGESFDFVTWPKRLLSGGRGTSGGNLWDNSAVGACLWYLIDTFPEAPLCVRRPGKAENGKAKDKKKVEGHPLAELVRRPNPAYSGALLWGATILSLTVDGNAYWRIVRNSLGVPIQLWYVPHWLMEPCWDESDPDGAEWISHYDRQLNGRVVSMPTADVIHFRIGLDPANNRKGMARLRTVIREILTDTEATVYTESILRNMGVPGAVFMPKQQTGGGPAAPVVDMTKGFKDRLKVLWREHTTGEKRGEALVLDSAFEIHNPGFSPEEMALDKIRRVPESRIAAALRVHAMVAQLSVGDDQRTYNNMGEAREMTYEGTIIPLQSRIADDIELQLLPQMSTDARDEVYFDTSEVRCLQQDVDALYKRIAIVYNAGLIKRKTGLSLLTLPFDETADDVYKTDLSTGPADPATDKEADPEADPKKVAAKQVWDEWQKKSRENRERAEREEADES